MLRFVIRFLTLSLCIFWSCQSKPVETTKELPSRPNIIFILADDLGYGDLTCYSDSSKIPTPHLDQLAQSGMRFTDAHTPSSVCTPTRYSLLTGRYAWRTKLQKGVLRPYDFPLIEDGRMTVANYLKQKGYKTSLIGKWHLGWKWPVEEGYPQSWEIGENTKGEGIDFSRTIEGGPKDAGFDYQFGVDLPNYPPYCYLENGKVVGELPSIPKPDEMYGAPGPMQEGWDLSKSQPGITKKALQYIREQAKGPEESPFFLYMPLLAPHVPLVPVAPYVGKSQAGNYGDFVVQVDGIVGKVTNLLDSLGIRENTLIFFSSDNGSHARTFDPIKGKTYHFGVGSVVSEFNHDPSGPYLGFKGDAWEGGHRVPLIASWPGIIPAQQVNRKVVGLQDFFATLFDLFNEEPPANTAEDSQSMWASLQDVNQPIRESLVMCSEGVVLALRRGDWKLIDGKGSGSKYSVDTPESLRLDKQLYNLKIDEGETTNLYDQEPEIAKALLEVLKGIKNPKK